MQPRFSVLLLLVVLLPAPAAAQEWLPSRREAAAGAALLGAGMLLDRTIAGTVPDGGGTRWSTLVLNHAGRPHYAVIALGTTAAAGTLTGHDEVRDGALRVTAGLLAAGVANGTLKYSLGRERPNTSDEPWRLRPLATDNRWQSFPSGHATVAFALAAALTEETGEPWVAAAGYGGAVLVGWSRVYENKHWTSDVVAGALVGIVGGRGTVRFLRRRGAEPPQVTIAPGWMAVRVPVR